jgi:hypothetical protein
MTVQNNVKMSRITGWIWLSTACIIEIFVNPSLMYITTLHIHFLRTDIAVLVWQVWKMSILFLFFLCLSACLVLHGQDCLLSWYESDGSVPQKLQKMTHSDDLHHTVLVVRLQEFMFLHNKVITVFDLVHTLHKSGIKLCYKYELSGYLKEGLINVGPCVMHIMCWFLN